MKIFFSLTHQHIERLLREERVVPRRVNLIEDTPNESPTSGASRDNLNEDSNISLEDLNEVVPESSVATASRD